MRCRWLALVWFYPIFQKPKIPNSAEGWAFIGFQFYVQPESTGLIWTVWLGWKFRFESSIDVRVLNCLCSALALATELLLWINLGPTNFNEWEVWTTFTNSVKSLKWSGNLLNCCRVGSHDWLDLPAGSYFMQMCWTRILWPNRSLIICLIIKQGKQSSTINLQNLLTTFLFFLQLLNNHLPLYFFAFFFLFFQQGQRCDINPTEVVPLDTHYLFTHSLSPSM